MYCRTLSVHSLPRQHTESSQQQSQIPLFVEIHVYELTKSAAAFAILPLGDNASAFKRWEHRALSFGKMYNQKDCIALDSFVLVEGHFLKI